MVTYLPVHHDVATIAALTQHALRLADQVARGHTHPCVLADQATQLAMCRLAGWELGPVIAQLQVAPLELDPAVVLPVPPPHLHS